MAEVEQKETNLMITYEHILGCYRKFKSYVYYSNNHNFLCRDLALYEKNIQQMSDHFNELVDHINNKDSKYFDDLISKITIVPLIKNIESKSENSNLYLNERCLPKCVTVESLNYFIKCPVDLYIIDTLWTLICFGVTCLDEQRYKYDYANYPAKDLTHKNKTSILERVNFKSLSIYEPYFEKYKNWQRIIIEKALRRHTDDKLDSKLVSLDITGFYYSAKVNFREINEYLIKIDKNYENYSFIEKIIENIYIAYKKQLEIFAKNDDKNISQSPIPIGLISSGFISNYYLSNFDDKLNHCDDVVLATRYVDDILILLNGHLKEKFDSLVNGIFKELFFVQNDSDKNDIKFGITGTDLIVKNSKTRLVDIKKNSSDYVLRKLKKEIFLPSGIKLFPKYVTDFDQLYNRSVDNGKSLKIRDNIVKPNINPGKLSASLGSLLRTKKDATIEESRIEKGMSKDLLGLINSDFIIATYSRWPILFSYFISDSKTKFNTVSDFTVKTLNKVKFANKKLPTITKNAVKCVLKLLYETAIAQTIAPLPTRTFKNEDGAVETKKLATLLRQSNLFNHSAVSFPLSNYLVCGREANYCIFTNDKYLKAELDSTKILFSPRFIHFDEYLYFKQCQSIYLCEFDNFDYDAVSKEYGDVVLHYFSDTEENVYIKKTENNNHRLFEVKYPSLDETFDNVPIAMANIDLSKYNLTKGEGYSLKLTFSPGTIREKIALFNLLNDCFFKKISRKKEKKSNDNDEMVCKFLVFPEYYLPLEWLNILIFFSRRAGITIVTGIRPIRVSKNVYNFQAVIVPFKDIYGHSESMVFIREKNNYAPLDKQAITNTGCVCNDAKTPTYFTFDNGKIRFSTFICYELTDVCARSLVKNKTDLVIASEYNEDIYYFSNIVESSARDLSSFIVQVNSSNYGDSRIVGPYRDKYKEIASITGGVKESIHIGIIKMKEYKDYLNDFAACDASGNYESISPTYTSSTKKYKIFKKPSAGSGRKP